jgi:hypothetical protein
MGIHAPRKRSAWDLLRQRGATTLVADLSQSLGRSYRTDALVPCVTPRGQIFVACGPVQRQLVPMEKLMLQGFPVHKMKFPKHVSDAALGQAAGNAMHVKCIAAALAIALAFVGRPPEMQAAPVKRAACSSGERLCKKHKNTGRSGGSGLPSSSAD